MRSMGSVLPGPRSEITEPICTFGPTAWGSGTSSEWMRSKPADRLIEVAALQTRSQVRRPEWDFVVVSGFCPASSSNASTVCEVKRYRKVKGRQHLSPYCDGTIH